MARPLDAPSRGHDLKLGRMRGYAIGRRDAPSRGHDLKQPILSHCQSAAYDAPSRGHDLKLAMGVKAREHN